MSEEYYSFEKTLLELQVDEERLRKLVGAGELRAFRDGATMKFKKTDVDAIEVGSSVEERETESDDESYSFNLGLIMFIVVLVACAILFIMSMLN